MKPILKYVGGKSRLLSQLVPLLPEKFASLVSPCLGSGALEFYCMENAHAYGLRTVGLADVNQRLIRMYRGIRDRPLRVAELLNRMPFTKEYYLERALQADVDAMKDDVHVAVWMLYVNRGARSGMYREAKNSKYKSRMNIPWGGYKRPNYATAEQLTKISRLLKRSCSVDFSSLDNSLKNLWKRLSFVNSFDQQLAKPLVFIDPPYEGTYNGYTTQGLIDIEQQRDRILDIVEAGGMVMYCNADVLGVRETFSDSRFTHHRIMRQGSMNSNYDERSPVGELVITAGY